MSFPSDKVMLRIVQSILAILIGIAWACADYGVVAAELPPSLQAHPAGQGTAKSRPATLGRSRPKKRGKRP